MKNKTILAIAIASLSSLSYASTMSTVPASPEDQVTMHNYQMPQYNHWSFQNFAIFPSLMIPRAGDVSTLPEKLDPTVADIQFTLNDETYTVRDAFISDGTDGYIILKDGNILHEEYFGDFGPRDHHLWASMTKSLVGQAMGLLVEQGKVDPDKTVETYIEELKGSHFGSVSVRSLLNMTTAIDYSEDLVNLVPGTIEVEYWSRVGLTPNYQLMALDPTKDDTPRGTLDILETFQKGEGIEPEYKFQYQSPHLDVAGWIIARVSGMPLQDFIAENFWSKLGVEHDAFIATDITYIPVATGGFNSTLRDMARVGLAMVNNGQYNGEQVFSEKWVKDTFALTEEEKKHVERSAYKDENWAGYDVDLEGYKNYIWVHDSEKKIGTFRGVWGQTLYFNQEKNIVVATFSSADTPSNVLRETNKARMEAFNAIADKL